MVCNGLHWNDCGEGFQGFVKGLRAGGDGDSGWF